ncbi:uncharacterized protein LOC119191723 [Manduca sexta]|uniref:uncharacterized protein LOC119191723 n=1 Tax=Manduca sexta TaxID=7130 RepID=UPI00188F4D38|nr:uncharacterized protein LOC119191723 [Manduca sexta]
MEQLEKSQNMSKFPSTKDNISQGPQNPQSHVDAIKFGPSLTRLEKPSTSLHHLPLQRSSTFEDIPHKQKLVPIKDWGVKFSGKGPVSINAFLERITELKEARNAGDEDLFRYAIDFFEEDALIWFRANKSSVSNWAELVKLLLDSFQPPYYQEELLQEIRLRTQSNKESVLIYIAVMQNMFNRLPVPISENEKLMILRKNLQPYFQKAICRDSFDSVGELTSVLRVIERTKLSCSNFKEPTLNDRSLEQDLAYHGSINQKLLQENMGTELAAIGNNGMKQSTSKCWNCRSLGHRFRDCKLPKQRLFCYKCGRFGNTVTKCPCTNTKKGNDHSESMPADRTPRM